MKSSCVKYIFLLSSTILLFQCQPPSKSQPEEIPVTVKYPFSVIATKNINFDTLLKAMEFLDTLVKEPHTFWLNIANDSNYHPFHRGICAHELLRRHVKDSMPLTGLTALIKNNNWIRSENINNRCIVRGGGSWKLISKMFNTKGRIFCVRIFPELLDTSRFKNIPFGTMRIRIGVSEDIPLENFKDFLLKGKTDPLIDKSYIIGVE